MSFGYFKCQLLIKIRFSYFCANIQTEQKRETKISWINSRICRWVLLKTINVRQKSIVKWDRIDSLLATEFRSEVIRLHLSSEPYQNCPETFGKINFRKECSMISSIKPSPFWHKVRFQLKSGVHLFDGHFSKLSHTEFKPNDHPRNAPHIIYPFHDQYLNHIRVPWKFSNGRCWDLLRSETFWYDQSNDQGALMCRNPADSLFWNCTSSIENSSTCFQKWQRESSLCSRFIIWLHGRQRWSRISKLAIADQESFL